MNDDRWAQRAFLALFTIAAILGVIVSIGAITGWIPR